MGKRGSLWRSAPIVVSDKIDGVVLRFPIARSFEFGGSGDIDNSAQALLLGIGFSPLRGSASPILFRSLSAVGQSFASTPMVALLEEPESGLLDALRAIFMIYL